MRTETFEQRWDRLRERTSVDGWKGPGSKRVPADAWYRAEQLTKHRPFVSVGANGSIFISWRFGLTVELRPDGTEVVEIDGRR